MKAFSFITELLPLAAAVLYVAYLIRENPQEPHEDEPPILPPEDWPEEYVREVEEELRRDSQSRRKKKERRRKP
jgi:predicted HAD superfamily Cof-like phosphohydrolase